MLLERRYRSSQLGEPLNPRADALSQSGARDPGSCWRSDSRGTGVGTGSNSGVSSCASSRRLPICCQLQHPETRSSPRQTAARRQIRLQIVHFRGEADAGTRTPDPFITSEVLYQLSYVGVCTTLPGFHHPRLIGAARVQQNPGRPLLTASVADVRGARCVTSAAPWPGFATVQATSRPSSASACVGGRASVSLDG